MKSKFLMAIAIGLSLGFSSWAKGTVYTGELGHPDDGFFADSTRVAGGGDSWQTNSILSWEVSKNTEASDKFVWSYEYSLNVEKFAPVRWVIETGSGFTKDNIVDITVSGEDADTGWSANDDFDIGTWNDESIGGDLRDMPEARYGLLLKNTSDGGGNTGGNDEDDIVVSFRSDMKPMWGDFYSNCGGDGNIGWNEGFELPNPIEAPRDGSEKYHVLVPTPEPSSIVLLGLAGLLLMKRRRV